MRRLEDIWCSTFPTPANLNTSLGGQTDVQPWPSSISYVSMALVFGSGFISIEQGATRGGGRSYERPFSPAHTHTELGVRQFPDRYPVIVESYTTNIEVARESCQQWHSSCQNHSVTSNDLSKTSPELSIEATMTHDPPSYTHASRHVHPVARTTILHHNST